jgi:hypothetical protein
LAGGGGAASELEALTDIVGFLNTNSQTKTPIKFTDVASLMDTLGADKALEVFREMQETGVGLEDPVKYLKAVAKKALSTPPDVDSEQDDVAKLTKRINWMNQHGGLSKKIQADEVVGALYCLGAKQGLAILRSLQEKGSQVADPTWYVKAAVQRANGVRVTPPPGVKPEDGEAYFDEEAGAMADGYEEVPLQADGYEDAYEEEFGEAESATEESWYAAAKDEGDWEEEDTAAEAAPASGRPKGKPAAKASAESKERRVVGGITGFSKLLPNRPDYSADNEVRWWEAAGATEGEGTDAGEATAPAPAPTAPSKHSNLPTTPQEKLVQCRDMAMKHGLNLDQLCLKSLARLPLPRVKDMIDDVLLGGKNRKGVTNPSRYLTIACQKVSSGLGVEQGIAMELAVSLGVVLNNDCLDELACIPRKLSHAIIRELSLNPEASSDPIRFVTNEVMKCRAQLDARPFPSG